MYVPFWLKCRLNLAVPSCTVRTDLKTNNFMTARAINVIVQCSLPISLDRYKFDSYSLVADGADRMPSLVIQMTKNLFSLQRWVQSFVIESAL